MLESSTPGGSVSWIRFSVLLEIQLLMVTRAFSGSSYRTGPRLRPEKAADDGGGGGGGDVT